MKRVIIICLGVFIFILILIGITFLESLKNRDATIIQKVPSPSGTIQKRKIQSPLVTYKKKETDKLLTIIATRPTPNVASDKTAREQIINAIGNTSGKIYTTSTYVLEYVKGPNSFEVEIKTTEISKAKSEAVEYLKARGLTEDGICKLPLMFYLNFETAKLVKNTSEKFSPIPDFCL